MPQAKGKEDPNRVMGRPQASHLHRAKMPQKGLHLPRPQPGQRHHACSGQRVRATAGQIARLLMNHRSHLKPLLKPQVPFPQLPQPQPLQLCCRQQLHMQLSQRRLELVNRCLPGPVSGGSSVALRVGFLFFLLQFQLCLPSERSTALPGMQSGPFHVDWIADSGAGRKPDIDTSADATRNSQ